MPTWSGLLLCWSLALVFYFVIGMALMLRVAPLRLAAPLAPITGWAVHTAAALPTFLLIGMSRTSVALAFIVPFLVSLLVLYKNRQPILAARPSVTLVVALGAAAALSLAVAMGAWPKVNGDSVIFAGPLFDHAKVAIVDEIARLGVPPGNPFFGDGAGRRLIYYYLWHFSAAELSLVSGVIGWTADVALTSFTAFASLCAMAGFAIWLGGRSSAALWAVALAATASARPLVNALVDPGAARNVIGEQSGFGAWFFQASWAPQHAASATAALLAAFLVTRIGRTPGIAPAFILAFTLAAAFGSSTWIGGIVVPLTAVIIAMFTVEQAERGARRRIALQVCAAGLLALVLAAPLILDQLVFAAVRGAAAPVVLLPYPVLAGTGLFRDLANLAAYWLVFLPVEFPAFFLTGLISLYWLKRGAATDGPVRLALAVVLFVGLLAAWLLSSTLTDNNDLGWRAVLPAVMVLIVFAAAGLSHLATRPRVPAFAVAVVLLLLGLPDGIKLIRHNLAGEPQQTSHDFARSAPLWDAVRQYASPDERVVNNPQWFEHMTPWRANTSWALLANRRSCYAGAALVEPFAALSVSRQKMLEALFERVFGGTADPDDLVQLTAQYNCNVVVLTPRDGAWGRDPFAASSHYRAVESNANWRIYKLVKLAANEQ